MEKVSKAIGAAVGGAVVGTGAGLYTLPEGSPWYAYVIMASIVAIVPAITTYYAPKNAN